MTQTAIAIAWGQQTPSALSTLGFSASAQILDLRGFQNLGGLVILTLPGQRPNISTNQPRRLVRLEWGLSSHYQIKVGSE